MSLKLLLWVKSSPWLPVTCIGSAAWSYSQTPSPRGHARDCQAGVALTAVATSEPFEQTITGREVCPDCANTLFMGSGAGAITGDVASGYGVWAMLMRKIRRSS